MNMKIIKEETWEKDMIDYIASFDADASGENGEDYLLDENYDSNTEYWIDIAKERTTSFEERIKFIMKSLDDTYGSYNFAEFGILKLNDKTLVVAFTAY